MKALPSGYQHLLFPKSEGIERIGVPKGTERLSTEPQVTLMESRSNGTGRRRARRNSPEKGSIDLHAIMRKGRASALGTLQNRSKNACCSCREDESKQHICS